MTKVNLNGRVKVRLTPAGRCNLIDYWRQYFPENPYQAASSTTPGWDIDNKYLNFQLYELMKIFGGKNMYEGCFGSFVDNDIVIEEKNL